MSPTRSPLSRARKPIAFTPQAWQLVRSSTASANALPNGAICFPLQASVSEGKMASPSTSTTVSTEAGTPQAGGSALLAKAAGPAAPPSARSSRPSIAPIHIPTPMAVQTQQGPPVQSARRSPMLSFRETRAPRRSASIGPLACHAKSPITSPRVPTPAVILTEAMAHSRSLRVGGGLLKSPNPFQESPMALGLHHCCCRQLITPPVTYGVTAPFPAFFFMATFIQAC